MLLAWKAESRDSPNGWCVESALQVLYASVLAVLVLDGRLDVGGGDVACKDALAQVLSFNRRFGNVFRRVRVFAWLARICAVAMVRLGMEKEVAEWGREVAGEVTCKRVVELGRKEQGGWRVVWEIDGG
jgi:hypothetical protein